MLIESETTQQTAFLHSWPQMNLRLDCRHFRGEKPCKFHCGCAACTHYEPMGTRILIIKLDAIGDVARTTTILRPLRAKYKPCHITWLLHPDAQKMLCGNPFIEAVLPYQPESLEALRVQRFDLVLSLDKSPRAAAVAMWTKAKEKLGFGLSEFGTVFSLNPESEYAFQLGIDDELKFRQNKKPYQELIFECIKLPYNRDEYAVFTDDGATMHAGDLLSCLGIGKEDKLVGLNMGGGAAFANKLWNAQSALDFLNKLVAEVDCKVLLFGAERERGAMEEIIRAGMANVLSAGTGNTVPQFQALLGRCDVVVTGDSLGMHLAIAEKRPVIVLFGPTCAEEIELYGRGEKMVSPIRCAPCYRAECERSPTCMEAIEREAVVHAVKRWLGPAAGQS